MSFQGSISIPFNSHATLAFVHLLQVPSKLLEMYFHYASELLSMISHMTHMSWIWAEALNH